MPKIAMPEETFSLATRTLDTSRCPLCGQSNQCANEVERATGVQQGPCWCTTATFDVALFARIPAEVQRLACVCAKCASINLNTN